MTVPPLYVDTGAPMPPREPAGACRCKAPHWPRWNDAEDRMEHMPNRCPLGFQDIEETQAPPTPASPRDLLIGTNQLLTELLAEVKHLRSDLQDSREHTSSVEVKYSAATKDNPSKPMPVVKRYTGSEPEVEEAIADYARAMQMMEELQMVGWAETVAMLKDKP